MQRKGAWQSHDCVKFGTLTGFYGMPNAILAGLSGNDTRNGIHKYVVRGMESDSLPVWGAMQRMQEMENRLKYVL